MERTTQYATTSDGVRIAFSTKGQGTPLIELPPIPFCHGAGPAEIPQWQEWDEEIARRAMLVDYDCRGGGMSQRAVADFTLEGWIRDVECVVDALGHDRVMLFAPDSLAVPTAIAFAVKYPERVSHLILWQAHTSLMHMLGDASISTVLELVEKDWPMFCKVFVQIMEGWSDPDTAHREALHLQELHEPKAISEALRQAANIDVSDLLAQVRAPTLVMHRRESRHPLEESMKVASGIPNAQFVLIEGTAFGWALEAPGAVLAAIDELIGWAPPPAAVEGNGDLTPREIEILRLLAAGRSSREIGNQLVLSVRTVERHISNIYRKIGAHNRAQATSRAVERGLLRAD